MKKIDPTSQPVDRVAARVIGSGVQFSPNNRVPSGDFYHAIVPPDFSPIPRIAGWEDFRGQRFNRLVVVGWLGRKKGKKGKWSVRCDCGMYEVRTTPALKHGEPMQMQCVECEYLEKVKLGLGHTTPQRQS
ncbi:MULTISPECIES: hypothetical protein [Sphingomonas]|uniref:hypothetical protein n=1 Tax=Sphingomonas TaxID=13687 RepID=UPI00254AEFEA|nr:MULTISPECIES: hypothetical protein [Sphingomonas]MDK8188154.1 hypothetical protein [Sphingomonas zeae]MDK8217849.1 hypothetical protein [Sphingomonas sp. UMB7805-LC452B]